MTGVIELRLPCREPFDGVALLDFLRARAVPGVESVDGTTYRRSLTLEHGGGLVELTPESRPVRCRLRLDDPADLAAAVARCRRLLDLDADPAAVTARLGPDPVLGPLMRRRPGLRVPGAVDGFEMAARAVVGQQVSVAAARTILGRLTAAHGEALAEPVEGVTHRFPLPKAIAQSDPGSLPFPRARADALLALARIVADDGLDLSAGADPDAVRATLLGIRGIGPWTVSYVSMRALADPDAWPPGDVGIRHALERLGQPSHHRAAGAQADGWRPWRSYAVVHLWSSL